MRKQVGVALICAAGLSLAGAAHAQYPMINDLIGQAVSSQVSAAAQAACMSGQPLPDDEIVEARGPSIETMQTYFAAAQGGQAKSAAFALDSRTRWQVGETTADRNTLDRQADPLAVSGHSLVVEPFRFFRSVGNAVALGQWAVTGADGTVQGVYTGYFVRRRDGWKLRTLQLSLADDVIEPAMQFCYEPGDVIDSRLEATEAELERSTTRLEALRPNFAKADARAMQSEAQAEGRGPQSWQVRDARRHREDATRIATEITAREAAVEAARAARATAERLEADRARLRVPARDAVRLASAN